MEPGSKSLVFVTRNWTPTLTSGLPCIKSTAPNPVMVMPPGPVPRNPAVAS